ncbi:hypothetical protein EDB85DRAFT_2162819 [Lactarius pseudohatsudake]|nr:hypothetical protein EDB85DRAFT_2162819 [Lactarius pseudohatsudake]
MTHFANTAPSCTNHEPRRPRLQWRRQQWRSPGHSYDTNSGDNAATTTTWNGAVNTTGNVDPGHNNGDDGNHDDNSDENNNGDSDENNKDYVTMGDDNIWTPADAELEGQGKAQDLAAVGCTNDPPDRLNRVNSASYQKVRARSIAFMRWEGRWHENRLIPLFRHEWVGEQLSFHQTYSDIYPPDPERPHPLWLQSTAAETLPSGRRRAKHTRCSTSTLMQVATDHAFTGTYV